MMLLVFLRDGKGLDLSFKMSVTEIWVLLFFTSGSEGSKAPQGRPKRLNGVQRGSAGFRGAQRGSEGLAGAQRGSRGLEGVRRGSEGLLAVGVHVWASLARGCAQSSPRALQNVHARSRSWVVAAAERRPSH